MTELKNIINKLKNILEGFNSTPDKAEIMNLKTGHQNSLQAAKMKKRRMKKHRQIKEIE